MCVPVFLEASMHGRNDLTYYTSCCVLSKRERMWFYIVCIGILVYFLSKRFLETLLLPHDADRHVLVTGCDTGFGNLLAKHLEKLGIRVFACCLTEQAQEDFRSHCSRNVIPLALDVTKEESVQNCLKFVKEKLGDKGLWGVVNNAGILGGLGPLEMLTIAHVEECVDVNLYGMIRVTKAFLPLLRKSRGRIVNASSMVGRSAFSFLPYSVSKYGVEAFSDRLRREIYRSGVTVHILEPGRFKTGFTTTEKIKHGVRTIFENADKDVKEYYGEEYVDRTVKNLCRSMGEMSHDLWKVVDAYTHALTARYPRYRYAVGVDAFVFTKLIAYLPEWLEDYLFFKLTQKRQ